jgi:hypothetical protein
MVMLTKCRIVVVTQKGSGTYFSRKSRINQIVKYSVLGVSFIPGAQVGYLSSLVRVVVSFDLVRHCLIRHYQSESRSSTPSRGVPYDVSVTVSAVPVLKSSFWCCVYIYIKSSSLMSCSVHPTRGWPTQTVVLCVIHDLSRPQLTRGLPVFKSHKVVLVLICMLCSFVRLLSYFKPSIQIPSCRHRRCCSMAFPPPQRIQELDGACGRTAHPQ